MYQLDKILNWKMGNREKIEERLPGEFLGSNVNNLRRNTHYFKTTQNVKMMYRYRGRKFVSDIEQQSVGIILNLNATLCHCIR